MDFVTNIVGVFTEVFKSFVAPLGEAIVGLFSSLFVVTGAEGAITGITPLAQGLLVFAAIGIVISGLYLVYNIFRSRSRKSL